MKRQNLITGVLLTIAIVVVVNVFSYFYFFRVDFTKDRRYTLSPTTKDILNSITKPVTITAYYSENSIPAVARARSEFKDILTEYAARSGNKVVYNFVNPDKNDSLEKLAQRCGVTPFKVEQREKDEMKRVNIYLGAVLKMGDKTDVLSMIDPNGSLEYDLSNSIKKLSIDKKPMLGLLQGNGEPTIAEMQQVDQSVSSLHTFRELKLSDSAAIPAEYTTIALMSPKDTFRPGQLRQLDAFLAKGGRMLIAYSGLNSELRTMSGDLDNIGLRQWLAAKNIVLSDKYIVEPPPYLSGNLSCGSVTIPQGNGGMVQIPFPYLPLIGNFANHPVTKDLRSVLLPFASAIAFTGDTNIVKVTPIAFTSEHTGLEKTPVTFDINHKWTREEFPLGNLVVGAAISGIGGSKDSRLIIISNGEFATNGSGKQAAKQDEDNISLFSNSVDWLSDNTGLIDLRSKVVKYIPIDEVSDSEKTFLKYFNFSFPILLILIYGIIRMQVKKMIRTKRMEEII